MKGCKFWPMLSTQSHWAVLEGSLECHTYSDTGHPVISRTNDTHTYSERLAVELSLPIFAIDWGLSRLGFENPTFRLRGERSNPLRHHRGCILVLPICFTAWDSIYDKICWYMYFSLSSKESVSHTTATSVARKTLGWIVSWKTSIVTESKAPVSTRTCIYISTSKNVLLVYFFIK